ncbi:unnamed protein product [Coregonus sp. 'balchen']|nr:unnamed protein product [Coregonus sp. 'balchen']
MNHVALRRLSPLMMKIDICVCSILPGSSTSSPLPTVLYQQSSTSSPLPTVLYQQSSTSSPLPTVLYSSLLPAVLYQQSSTSSSLPTVLYQQFFTNSPLPAVLYQQSSTGSPLPAALYRQSSTSSPLPAVLYQQSSTSSPLPASAQPRRVSAVLLGTCYGCSQGQTLSRGQGPCRYSTAPTHLSGHARDRLLNTVHVRAVVGRFPDYGFYSGAGPSDLRGPPCSFADYGSLGPQAAQMLQHSEHHATSACNSPLQHHLQHSPDPFKSPGTNQARPGAFPGTNSPGPVADLYGTPSQDSGVGNYISAASPQPGSGFGHSIAVSMAYSSNSSTSSNTAFIFSVLSTIVLVHSLSPFQLIEARGRPGRVFNWLCEQVMPSNAKHYCINQQEESGGGGTT